ncbi:hypothetical protein RRG08_064586 [Elysia crispata]|uniref:Uncharacterized protein n=1 Tax=Elysia crispata TaxID=231223 RepID=A0AAE1ECL1_9GAST|nr:hypothetical protein RRG08_064586 [Elysia crispata]
MRVSERVKRTLPQVSDCTHSRTGASVHGIPEPRSLCQRIVLESGIRDQRKPRSIIPGTRESLDLLYPAPRPTRSHDLCARESFWSLGSGTRESLDLLYPAPRPTRSHDLCARESFWSLGSGTRESLDLLYPAPRLTRSHASRILPS